MKKLLCIVCTAFVALLSLSSCNKSGDSDNMAGDSGIVGTWKLNKVTDLKGVDQGMSGETTVTFNANGLLNIHFNVANQAYDYPPVHWTKNGDSISFDEYIGDGAIGFKILENTAQKLDLQVIYVDGFDLIWYLTRV